MLQGFLNSGTYLLIDGLILGLASFLVYRKAWIRLRGIFLYLVAYFSLDAVARGYVLYHFGVNSHQYFYCYWLTDVAITLGAFLLVCAFFRRASARHADMWRYLRLMLVLVFVLVVGISAFSLSQNYGNLFGILMIEFQQDLYFTCLVLNTMLYIFMQQMDTADDELGLLVTGMGLQFAGPAASLALKFLAPNLALTESLMHIVLPLCTLGMLSTWFYAVARKPKTALAPTSGEMVPVRVSG
jgi:lipoprotein signal peptidase